MSFPISKVSTRAQGAFRALLLLGCLVFSANSSLAAADYVGDDAAEGLNVTNGTGQDTSGSAVTYDFVGAGTTYTNTTNLPQRVTFNQVNFYAGTVTGTMTPFASVYAGDQTATSIKAATNYRVIAIGDPLGITGNSGLQNRQFMVGGVHPSIVLEPRQVLAVGYLATAGGIVRYSGSTGVIDYIALANTLPATLPNPFTASAGTSLDRTLKFNVSIDVAPVPPIYIGDDTAEGLNVTNGTNQDSLSTPVTYDFVQVGTTYKNTTRAPQQIILSQVNFYAGSVSGTMTPFVASYSGDQSAASIKTAANYQVIQLGDPISITANSGLQNKSFLAQGSNPCFMLAPNQTLTAGYLASKGGIVRYGTSSGTIDYVALANTLPPTAPNSFTANATTNLDRVLKFNVGFAVRTGPFKVACIGDSITAGVGATSNPYCYVSQLQALLGNAFAVTNYGVSSRTMLKKGDYPYWNEAAYANSLASLPDIVVIMLGTNDSKPQNWVYKSEFLSNYTEMINSYKSLATQPKVFVNTCPTVAGSGNWGINNPVVTNEIVPLVKQAAADTGASVIDINTGTAFIPLDFPDNVHPNNAGHLALSNIAYHGLTGQQVVVSSGTYKIVGKYSGKPIEIAGADLSDGASLDQATDTGVANQKWVISTISGVYCKIQNVNSGKVADVAGGSTSSGAQIVQSAYSGALSQQWQIIDVGLGYFNLVNRGSGYVLDVTGASPADGALLQQAATNTTLDQQKFEIIQQ